MPPWRRRAVWPERHTGATGRGAADGGLCARPIFPPEPAACTAAAAPFAASARDILARFDEADAVAAASERDALLAAIETLSEIRGEVSALQPPECAVSAKVQVVRYMDATIRLRNEGWSGPCGLCVYETLDLVRFAKGDAIDALQALGGD